MSASYRACGRTRSYLGLDVVAIFPSRRAAGRQAAGQPYAAAPGVTAARIRGASEDREGDMARGKTIHFLLTYDRSERRLVNMERFHNGKKAVDTYGEREREYADRPQIEVVLLGADSEDAIRVTHPVYFRTEPLSMERIADLPSIVAEAAAG